MPMRRTTAEKLIKLIDLVERRGAIMKAEAMQVATGYVFSRALHTGAIFPLSMTYPRIYIAGPRASIVKAQAEERLKEED